MPLDTAAPFPALSAATLFTATVCGTDPLAVLAGGVRQPATRSPGCLVAPQAGDAVLATDTPDGWVLLHVVARPGDGGVVLSHPAGLTLRSPVLALEGDALHVRANVAKVALRSASLVAGVLRTVADRLEQAAGHLLSHAGSRTTVVTGTDVLDAHVSTTTVATALTVQTGTAVVTAETDIRMDAERISLG